MLKVVVVGLGPIGVGCTRAVLAESGLELAGLVDIDPKKVGLTTGEVTGLSSPEDANGTVQLDLKVTDDLNAAVASGADVAIVTTRSRFAEVLPTVQTLLDHGVAVVSSCEQMVWPWYRHAELATQLDERAKRAGRAVLATGVNPGFAMDVLPVTLASVLRRVAKVRCVRRVDVGTRRVPLEKKLGVTLEPSVFRERFSEADHDDAGLAEAVSLVAAGLGRQVRPSSVEETVEPVLAERPTPSSLGLVTPGRVAGVHHMARWKGRGLTIELDLTMAVGLTDPYDKVCMEGPVQLCMKIPGALPGDSATVALLVNHVRQVHKAAAGLRTMLDLPPSGCCNCDRGLDVAIG